jgi:hypothetical protein
LKTAHGKKEKHPKPSRFLFCPNGWDLYHALSINTKNAPSFFLKAGGTYTKKDNMDEHNEKMLAALREIDAVVVAALRDQPEEVEHLRRHLNKALAIVELKAHCSRHGLT